MLPWQFQTSLTTSTTGETSTQIGIGSSMVDCGFSQVPSVDYSSYRSQTPRVRPRAPPAGLELDSQPQDPLLDRISFIASEDIALAPGKPLGSLRVTAPEAALKCVCL